MVAVTVPAAASQLYLSRSQVVLFPSVTSAQSGPCSCTLRCSSSTPGQTVERAGLKSVSTDSTSAGLSLELS